MPRLTHWCDGHAHLQCGPHLPSRTAFNKPWDACFHWWLKYERRLLPSCRWLFFSHFLSWAEERQKRRRRGNPERQEKFLPSLNRFLFCFAAVKPGPGMAGLLHSRSGHVLSKVWMTSTSTCVECFRPRPGCSLANASLTARRARHGYGWWDARSSLPLEKQVKRHAFLKVVRIPLNPECFTALWDTKETRSNICWGQLSMLDTLVMCSIHQQLWGRWHYTHFTDEETGAMCLIRVTSGLGCQTWSNPQSWEWNPGWRFPQHHAYCALVVSCHPCFWALPCFFRLPRLMVRALVIWLSSFKYFYILNTFYLNFIF